MAGQRVPQIFMIKWKVNDSVGDISNQGLLSNIWMQGSILFKKISRVKLWDTFVKSSLIGLKILSRKSGCLKQALRKLRGKFSS